MPGIDDIWVKNQGTGSVNAVGRSDLVFETVGSGGAVPLIYNINHSRRRKGVPSWAVHQYHKNIGLRSLVDTIADDIVLSLEYQEVKDDFNSFSPIDIVNSPSLVILQPSMGSHRYNTDAIFATGEDIDLNVLVLFLNSIRKTGFNGDIVLSVSERNKMRKGVYEFLRSHTGSKNGLVVYEGVFLIKEDGSSNYYLNGMYGIDGFAVAVDDPRQARIPKVARFELFWAWSRNYQEGSRILLLDAADSNFTVNPFSASLGTDRCTQKLELHFYEESNSKLSVPDTVRKIVSDEPDEELGECQVASPDAVLGNQYLVEKYLRDMVQTFDDTKCYGKGCDMAVHNYIWFYEYSLFPEGVSISRIKHNYDINKILSKIR